MRYLLLTFFLIYTGFGLVFAEDNDIAQTKKADQLYFLVLADIHFNPFTSCEKKNGSCPLIQKLRQANVHSWPALFKAEGMPKPHYRQDTNYTLLASALAAAQKAAVEQQVDFVIIAGDFLGHDFRRRYKLYSGDRSRAGFQTFVHKVFEFLTNELNAAFPAIDVYSVIGNNDSYQGDYVTALDGTFFHDMNALLSGLIKNPANRLMMQRDFSTGGYYHVTLSKSANLQLIVLNSNVFSYKAKGRAVSTIAKRQFDWLQQQLNNVKENKQKTLIAMHIPLGVDVYISQRVRLFRLMELWAPTYSLLFEDDLNNYSAEIAGLIMGHLHSDSFQMLSFENGREFPAVINPAISPILGTNPTFKIYKYSADTGELENYVTYYYPLDREEEWDKEYAALQRPTQLAMLPVALNQMY